MGRVCPRCGKAVPRGAVHRCKNADVTSRDKELESSRRASETWRGGYSSRDYEAARRRALERSQGHCEACGEPVFIGDGGRWRKLSRDFGGTHHVVPLSRGGQNSESNVVVLCARCHGLAHSNRCKGATGAGELLGRLIEVAADR